MPKYTNLLAGLVAGILGLSTLPALAARVPTPTSPDFATTWDRENFNHGLLNGLLRSHVDRVGRVDYNGLRRSSLSKLYEYLYRLSKTKVKRLSSRNARFAYWINAYNAITLKAVLDRLPSDRAGQRAFQVTKVKGFWKEYLYEVDGRWLSLDDIEHKILRVEYPDPRLHFAIVCASEGCPDLEPRAYLPQILDRQLQEATSKYLASPRAFQIDRARRIVRISQLFNWFKGDFQKAPYHHELSFIAAFLKNPDDQVFLRQNKSSLKIEYLPYSWKLNLR